MFTTTKPPIIGAVLALSLTALGGTASAGAGDEAISVRIRGGDLHPATVTGARQLLHRIEAAALEVCGASPFSLDEVKFAVRRSDCWRKAVADAVVHADVPALTKAFARESGGWR